MKAAIILLLYMTMTHALWCMTQDQKFSNERFELTQEILAAFTANTTISFKVLKNLLVAPFFFEEGHISLLKDTESDDVILQTTFYVSSSSLQPNLKDDSSLGNKIKTWLTNNANNVQIIKKEIPLDAYTKLKACYRFALDLTIMPNEYITAYIFETLIPQQEA